jgi:hypothetical protein
MICKPGHMGIHGNEIGPSLLLTRHQPALDISAKVASSVIRDWMSRKH